MSNNIIVIQCECPKRHLHITKYTKGSNLPHLIGRTSLTYNHDACDVTPENNTCYQKYKKQLTGAVCFQRIKGHHYLELDTL